MAGQLKVTDGVLDELRTGLQSIVSQLQDSSSFGSDISGLVGHPGLASKVDSFASGWAVHRSKMIDATTKVHDAVVTIDNGFAKVDGQLSSALTTKGN